MSSHALTVTGYAVICLGAVVLQALSRRRDSRIPLLGDLARRVMASRRGRIGLLAGWAWLGLHFFAR